MDIYVESLTTGLLPDGLIQVKDARRTNGA
jgi:hypothetical protein